MCLFFLYNIDFLYIVIYCFVVFDLLLVKLLIVFVEDCCKIIVEW